MPRFIPLLLTALLGSCESRPGIPDEGLMIAGADGITDVGDLDGDGWTDHVAWFTSEQLSGGDIYLDFHVLVYLQGIPLGESWTLSQDGERVDEYLASSAIYLGDRREGVFSLVAAGDMDADGRGELAIGACTNLQFQDECSQSRVVLFPGMEEWPEEVFEQSAIGAVELEDFDQHDPAGDLSADGTDHVLLRFGGAGDFLLLGNEGGWLADPFEHLVSIAALPGKAAAVGDIDADGVDDLVTVDEDDVLRIVFGGAPWADPAIVPTVEFSTDPYGDLAPLRVGDLTGDGVDDLALVAEEGAGCEPDGLGGLIAIRGRDRGEWAEVGGNDLVLVYPMPCDVEPMRFTATGGGDVDGDGRGDVLISEPLADPGDVVARVGLLLGVDLARGNAEPSWSQDYSVVLEPRFVGRVDDDEYDDIAVSLEGMGTWIYPGRAF